MAAAESTDLNPIISQIRKLRPKWEATSLRAYPGPTHISQLPAFGPFHANVNLPPPPPTPWMLVPPPTPRNWGLSRRGVARAPRTRHQALDAFLCPPPQGERKIGLDPNHSSSKGRASWCLPTPGTSFAGNRAQSQHQPQQGQSCPQMLEPPDTPGK